MSYYYGFLFSIIVNSIIWFLISTVVNKYYWHYTGFKDEFYLASKYFVHRNKTKTENDYDANKKEYQNNNSSNLKPLSKINDNRTNNIGSPIKS
jgi:hypothetical protein